MAQHLTNPPAIITQLANQLDACAAWSGISGNDYYPRVTWANATLPLAVLEESERQTVSYAAGAGGIAGGQLKITLHFAQTSDDGTVETAARTILDQLLAQSAGIVFRTADCGLSGTFSSAEAATDTATIAIIISLAYGLNV